MSHRRPTVACLLFNYHISPFCDVAQTSDCGIVVFYFSIKALSVMSPRRPTVAFLFKPLLWCRPDVRLWHFFSSPFCDVALTSDCGISLQALSVMSPRRPTVAFLFKPFLWRRPDVRLRYFFLSPLCGVAKTPDCGIFFFIIICSPFGASLQTPDRFPFIFLSGFQVDYRRFPFTYLVKLIFDCTLVN